MEASLKKILKSVTLELRHLLEGRYDNAGAWQPGDLETRLASIGVRGDRDPRPADELRLTTEDQHARKVVDAYLKLREEAGVLRAEAVAEFLRETAYTWANRLIALRCMESRELIDSVILQQEAYGGRSLEHHRLAQRQPELCAGEDDGLFAVLDKVFREQAERLPMLFDPQSPGVVLRPSPAAIKDCFGLLSLNTESLRKYRIRIKEEENADADAEPLNPFVAPDALGWTYQYWNTEEKDRVFEKVRTVKGAKISGADIVPATQLYTEDYMVKYLVQNSLGATWMGMHPESRLCERWEYYVRDADRAPIAGCKPVREITFLDPACGSGHFLLEAFDLLYAMYEEEDELSEPAEICNAILTQNLFGIDIDARAVQIAEAALWMKAAERAFDYSGTAMNLVAATASHLKGPAWEEFLADFKKEPSVARVLRKFAQTMEHIDEIGSLARPAEDLRSIIKEEHATWERQVREQKEANFLFADMRKDALSGQLAFDDISDEEFGDRLFYRARAGIDAFTVRARESGEFDDQMLASETRTGFRLLNLLGRRYDVVAANPPYMGSRKMGSVVKRHIAAFYKPGKRDIYAAFILRSCELTNSHGRCAMITLHSWMFLTSYATLRPLLLQLNRLELIAHLGRHAFSEADPPGNAAMVVFNNVQPQPDSQITSFRMTSSRPAAEQANLLKAGIEGRERSIQHRTAQSNFEPIPNQPIVYWINDDFFRILTSSTRVAEIGGVKQGLATGDNSRHLRFHWEVPSLGSSWVRYAKGGGYCKWYGLHTHVIDWRGDGAIYRSSRRAAIRNPDTYFKSGLTYTLMARGSLGLRLIDSSVYDVASMSIFPEPEATTWLMGVLNCRLLSYLARVVSQDIKFNTSYVSSLPLPDGTYKVQIEELVNLCVALKRRYISLNPIETSCDPSAIASLSVQSLAAAENCINGLAALLHTIEGISETLVVNSYRIGDSAIEEAVNETGRPSGWLPLASGIDQWPMEFNDIGVSIQAVASSAEQLSRVNLPADALATKRSILKGAFIAGPGGAGEDADDDETPENPDDPNSDSDSESDDEEVVGDHLPIRPETFLEELSQTTQLHPISVYLLLKHGAQNEGWACVSEQTRILTDLLTVAVLQLLGHCWPESDSSKSKPLSDSDGIIPLVAVVSSSSDPGEQVLCVCLRSQLAELVGKDRVRGLETEANALFGQSLESWCQNAFFQHHTSQFKKRPIAWQVQSSNFTGHNTPAIACMIYYHKLDGDMLRKVRKLAEDLRKSRETELRGILSIASDARSDRQEKRRVELEDVVVELQRFDSTLETVATTGFGPDSLRPALRQFALNDSMLALKCRWLRRLSELVVKGPLDKWLQAASKADLHPHFGDWLGDALSRLDHFCARVGPQPPDQEKLGDDPTAADLAELIAAEAETMFTTSLRLACDVWWKPFHETVLQPFKDQVKELKEEQKQSEARLKADPEQEPSVVRGLKARVKELKAEIKKLNAEIDKKTGLAQGVRNLIEAWRSSEPATWGDWLGEQPLFDQISSLDDRRSPPTTIAAFVAQESLYAPDINDGVRVNIAPLQKAGLLAADVLAAKDIPKAIADRAEWRSDERRWVREGKLPRPAWWNGEV